MLGCINGVAACIERDEPSAIYVHCLAHCTNLCLQTVGRQVTPVRDALELVKEASQLICFSPDSVPVNAISTVTQFYSISQTRLSYLLDRPYRSHQFCSYIY